MGRGGCKSFSGSPLDLGTVQQPLLAPQVQSICGETSLEVSAAPSGVGAAFRGTGQRDANLRGLPAGLLFSAFLSHGTYLLRRKMAAESATL